VYTLFSTLRYTQVLYPVLNPEVYPGVYMPPYLPFVGGMPPILPLYTRFTVGQYCRCLPPYAHMEEREAERLPGASFYPFHCWARKSPFFTRFTAGKKEPPSLPYPGYMGKSLPASHTRVKR